MKTNRSELLESLSSYQIGVVAICAAIYFFGSYSSIAMGFSLPLIAVDWEIERLTVGFFFREVGHVTTFGMVLGAVLIAPLGDRFGRRMVMGGALIALTGALFLTAASSTTSQLLACRVISGISIGAILPIAMTTVAESAPDRNRNLCIGLVHVAAMGSGFLVAMAIPALIDRHGWMSAFIAGGAASALVTLLTLALVPESPAFLLRKTAGHSLEKLNTALARMRQRPVDPEAVEALLPRTGTLGVRGLFEGDRAIWSVMLWACFLWVAMGRYFVNAWMAQIPPVGGDADLSPERVMHMDAIFNIGGAIGVVWMGMRSRAQGVRPMLVLYLLSSFALVAVLGFLPPSVTLTQVMAFLTGLFVNGSFVGLLIAAVRLYDTGSCCSGLGWAIGIGGVGSILNSNLFAYLPVVFGLSRGMSYLYYGTPFLLAAILIAMLNSRRLMATAELATDQPN